jgi:molybdopterin-guanine dinucleotide biosynthesis protein A
MDPSDITGVILAGGNNSRYGGKIKSREIIGGEMIISSILRIIRPVFKEIVLVTNTPEEFTDLKGCFITGDHFLKRGPLGGIHAAMKASARKAIFVFGGDMPFLNGELILAQAEDFISSPADALIPRHNGAIEPLHAIYKTDLAGKLENFLTRETDNMIRTFLDEIRVRYFEITESETTKKAFTNINTPEDVKIASSDKTKM